jgi:hypothetical protein
MNAPVPTKRRFAAEGLVFVETFPSMSKAQDWAYMMEYTCSHEHLRAAIPDLAVFAANLAEHVRLDSLTHHHWANPSICVDWGAGLMQPNEEYVRSLRALMRSTDKGPRDAARKFSEQFGKGIKS